jgi:N-acetylglucosaminyldiphosphoundecaprenol N-acetyl-beta-D-mannosaminyltransferase
VLVNALVTGSGDVRASGIRAESCRVSALVRLRRLRSQPPPTTRATPAPPAGRLDVLGVGISPLNLSSAVQQIESWIDGGHREYVCFSTVHGVMESQKSARLMEAFNRAGMVAPDGMPLVWLLRRSHHADSGRVYGPDLMLAAIEHGIPKGWRHYLYGGGEGVIDTLAERLSALYPGVQIVGRSAPPIASVEELASEAVVRKINQAGPDIVWVGLGTPKQELWMADTRSRLEAPALIGVGAAFDFNSGRVRQAPRWIQSAGMEWAFRLSQEPRRLWRRYLINNSWFIYKLALERMTRRFHGS